MHLTTTMAIAVLALVPAVSLFGLAKAAEPLHIEVCPSRDKAEQARQSNGSLSPDGCRTVTVTRVDSPAGPMCAMKFGESKSGVIGQITSAVETTEWWTACSNLQAP